MKRLLTLFALCVSAASAPAADLLAVYQRALQNDPQLRGAEATRLAALETKPQALAALLPQIAGSGLVTREHDTGPETITQPLSSPPGPVQLQTYPFDGRIVTTTHKYGIDLKQNLFRWENWVALQRADAQVAQALADYQAAQQDLMTRVAQRYFDVLAAQDDLEAQQVALTSIQRQLDQAESRFQIGLIAITDVEEARAGRHCREALAGLHPGTAARDHRRRLRLAGPSHRTLRAREPGPHQRRSLGRHGVAAESRARVQPVGSRYRTRKYQLRTRRPLSLSRLGGQPLQDDHQRGGHV